MVNGAVETTTTYEPYGKVLAQTGSSGTTYGYTGEQYDALTSLVYLRARYYNPSLKLFMSRDPFPGWMSLPASQHDYTYVHNDPVNKTDPTGNCPWCLVTAGLGYIYSVGSQTYHNMQNGMPFFEAVYYKNHDQAAILKAIKTGALLPLELIPGVDGPVDGFLDQLIDNLADPCVGWSDNLIESAARGTAVDLAFFGFGTTIRRISEVPGVTNGFRQISDYVSGSFYYQGNRATCGIACLRMAQERIGVDVLSESDIIRRIGSLFDEFSGISFKQLPEVADSIGLKATTFEDASLTNLARDFASSDNVIILDVDPGIMYGMRPGRGPGSPFGHAVVLTDVQVNSSGQIEKILIHDPELGPSIPVDPELFLASWEARYQRYAIVNGQ
jgi:RHS repeat-associated protein